MNSSPSIAELCVWRMYVRRGVSFVWSVNLTCQASVVFYHLQGMNKHLLFNHKQHTHLTRKKFIKSSDFSMTRFSLSVSSLSKVRPKEEDMEAPASEAAQP